MTRPSPTVEHWYERNHVKPPKGAQATTARRQTLRKVGQPKPWDWMPMQTTRKTRRQSGVWEDVAVVAAAAITVLIYAILKMVGGS